MLRFPFDQGGIGWEGGRGEVQMGMAELGSGLHVCLLDADIEDCESLSMSPGISRKQGRLIVITCRGACHT